MSRVPLIVVLVIAVASAPSSLSGQNERPVETADLIPVDQMVADHHDLATSLRIRYTGIDDPNDFSELFRLPGPKGDFVRAQGGLYTIFAHSVYTFTKKGEPLAAIPAGALFHIGRPGMPPGAVPTHAPATRLDLQSSPHAGVFRLDPRVQMDTPALLPERAHATESPRRMDRVFKQRRLETMTGSSVPIPDPSADDAWVRRPETHARTIATDPVYRSARLRTILLAAADTTW